MIRENAQNFTKKNSTFAGISLGTIQKLIIFKEYLVKNAKECAILLMIYNDLCGILCLW